MLAGALCFARERERHTLAQLRYRSGSNPLSALHGKSLPYALCISGLCSIMLFIIFPLYGIVDIAAALRVVPSIVLFLCASWWIGALVGIISGKVLVSSSLSFGIGMPSFLFSGWTFPLPAAPYFYTLVAAVLPFPHFMPLWFSAAEKGRGPFSLPSELLILLAIAVIAHVATHIALRFFWNPATGKKVPHV
jgi:ABC-2 type transport system permease protein